MKKQRLPATPLAMAIFAYAWWGFVPAYWKQLPLFSSWELISWRVALSLLSLLPVLAWRREFPAVWQLIRRPSSCAGLLATAFLIGFNWSLYIWAVTNGHIIESSLGYFLNPLMNMAIGTVVLKERLNGVQRLAFLLAALGVGWLTWRAGSLPWIALLLALSFTLYGLGRKLLRLPTLPATAVETVFLFPPAAALLYSLWGSAAGVHGFVAGGSEWAWLALAGPVTTIPLLAFAEAAIALPLTTLGFIQFVSPTFQFLLGFAVYHEPFSPDRALGFALIWAGLGFFVSDLYSRNRRLPAARRPDIISP